MPPGGKPMSDRSQTDHARAEIQIPVPYQTRISLALMVIVLHPSAGRELAFWVESSISPKIGLTINPEIQIPQPTPAAILSDITNRRRGPSFHGELEYEAGASESDIQLVLRQKSAKSLR